MTGPAHALGFRAVLRYGLLALIVAAPLPFGAARPGGVLALQLGAAGLAAGALWVVVAEPLPWGPRSRRIVACVGGMLALGTLQLAPLPARIVERLAPRTAGLREAVEPHLESAPSAWVSLSLAPGETLDALLRLATYGLIGFVAAVVLRERRDWKQAAWALAGSGAFQALYGGFEYLSGRQQILGFAKQYYLSEATGTFVNRSHYAGHLAMLLPLALALLLGGGGPSPAAPGWRGRVLRWLQGESLARVASMGVVASIWAGILLSSSRGGLAAGLLATAYVAWATGTRRRTATLLALVLLVPTSYLAWLDIRAPGERFGELPANLASESARPAIWRATARMVGDYAIFGAGLGTFEALFPLYCPPEVRTHVTHAHNDWLESAASGGPALPLLAGMALLAVLAARRGAPRGGRPAAPRLLVAAAKGGILAVAFQSLFDFGLRIPANASLLAFLAGALIAAERRESGSGP